MPVNISPTRPIGAGNLAALAVDVDVVAEVVIDAEEVEHVAGFAAGAATEADRGDRQAAEEPDGDVEVVDVLLDDVVAGHFGEVEPVAGHVGGVGLALVAALDPWHGAVPLDHAALDLRRSRRHR